MKSPLNQHLPSFFPVFPIKSYINQPRVPSFQPYSPSTAPPGRSERRSREDVRGTAGGLEAVLADAQGPIFLRKCWEYLGEMQGKWGFPWWFHFYKKESQRETHDDFGEIWDARWDQKLWAAVLMGFNGDVWWCVIGYLVRICNTRYVYMNTMKVSVNGAPQNHPKFQIMVIFNKETDGFGVPQFWEAPVWSWTWAATTGQHNH